MSTIFELGYEFSDPLEKELFIIERTADINLRRIFDQMDICVIMEADGKNETGGLIGLIKKGLKAISTMIGSILTSIGSLFAGKPTEKNVKFSKNPKQVVEKADKIVNQDTGMLKKLANGKIDPNKVIDAVDKHKGWFDEIKPFAGPALSLATGYLVNEKVLVRWRREIDQACELNYDALSDYAETYARSQYASTRRATVKEAAQYLMKDIRDASAKGSNALTDYVKHAMVEARVSKIIQKEADGLTSKKGGIKYRNEQRLQQFFLNRNAKKLRKEKERIEEEIDKNKQVKKNTAKAKQNLADARSDFYVDTGKRNYYVTPPSSLQDRVRSLNQLSRDGVDPKEISDVEIKPEKDKSLRSRIDDLNQKSQSIESKT